MLDKREKAAARRKALKAREEQARHDAYDQQCRENEAKGLTKFGYTKTFEGESVTFYLNNVEVTCKVDYDQMSPHLEFRGEPSVLTETGYRSHFLQTDLSHYGSLRDAVADQVEYIIRNRFLKNSKAKYTLSWKPGLEYLRHSPVQLSLFEPGNLDNCAYNLYNDYRQVARC